MTFEQKPEGDEGMGQAGCMLRVQVGLRRRGVFYIEGEANINLK